MKVPTEQQYRKLAVLGANAIVLAPGRREWGPLLRRGWVEPLDPDDGSKRFLPPLRITPAGLRAMADAMERHDLAPDLRADRPRQLDEAPIVTKLKAERDEAREQRDSAQRELRYAKNSLRVVQRTVRAVFSEEAGA